MAGTRTVLLRVNLSTIPRGPETESPRNGTECAPPFSLTDASI